MTYRLSSILNGPFSLCLLLLSIALTISDSVLGQEAVWLDSVAIIGERLPLQDGHGTKLISVLEAEQIASLPAQSLDDLLRAVPGVNVNARGGFGVQADIGIRGSTFGQVLILLDGMRLNDPLTGHFNHALPIPLSEIARIEVIKGPGTAAYGADAMGGVIHIITKGMTAVEPGAHLQLEQRMGSNGSLLLDAASQIRDGKFNAGIGIRRASATGEELINPTYLAGNSVRGDSTYHNEFDMQMATVNLGYEFNNRWSIAARGAFDQRDFKAKYWYTASAFDDAREQTKTTWLQSRIKYVGNQSLTSLQTSYRNNEDLFVFNPFFSPNTHVSKRVNIGLDHLHEVGNNTQLALGLLWSQREIESTDRGNHDDINQAAYIMVSQDLFENLRLQGGLRLEEDENFGTEIIPQLGASYSKNQFRLRAEVGQSIRAADYTERYISDLIPELSDGRNLGNPDLEVERAINYSLGASYGYANSRFDFDVFSRDGENLIDFLLTSAANITTADNLIDTAQYLYAQNFAQVQTRGLEVRYGQLWEIREGLSLTSTLAYTYLETSTPDGTEPSKYLSSHPKHDVDISLSAETKLWRANVLIEHTTRQKESLALISGIIPADYTLLHADLSVKLAQELALSVSIRNLMDTSYQEILGAQMPGRWVMVGVDLSL